MGCETVKVNKRMAVVIIIVALSLVGIRLQINSINDLTEKVDTMKSLVNDQEGQIQTLQNQLETIKNTPADEDAPPWFWDVYDYAMEPDAFIKSLEGQELLIPFEGVLGGNIYFLLDQAEIIDPVYVYVPIEDGHMLGGVMLKYKILSDHEVEWRFVDGWWPAEN